jgi:hypothetical protein
MMCSLEQREIVFATQHYEGYGQQGLIEQLKPYVIYVDHRNFITKFKMAQQMADETRVWLWRVIVEWDGFTIKGRIDPLEEQRKAEMKAQRAMLPKVYKMEKGEATWMEPLLTDGMIATYHEVHKADKPRWKCKCGLVWTMKHDAQSCEARGHKDNYELVYGGRIVNGQHVNGTRYVIKAVRKEEPVDV